MNHAFAGARAGLLLALASAFGFATGTAHAQSSTSSVQLNGLIGLYVDHLQRADSPTGLNQMGHGGLTTSFIGVKGQEDLGGGLKAVFAVESFFQPDTGASGRNATDTFWARNAFVGLSHAKYGTLQLGRQTNPTYIAMNLLSPFGNSVVFSPLTVQTFVAPYGGTFIGDTGWSNAAQYISPTFSGTQVAAIQALGEVSGKNGKADTGLHLRSVKGPLTVAVSWQRVRTAVTGTATQQKAWLAGAAYDFGIVKVYGSAANSSTDGTGVKARTYDAGVSIPVGATGAIWIEHARTKRDNPTIADTTRKTTNLAYDYRFSKRTDAYLVYSRDSLTGYSSGDTYGFGVRHAF